MKINIDFTLLSRTFKSSTSNKSPENVDREAYLQKVALSRVG